MTKTPQIILAPMAGITDLSFRLLCKELGADVVYSEMISATGINFNKEKNLQLANSCTEDFPLYLQLFGSEPKHFAQATKIINGLPDIANLKENDICPRKPEGIDINFGCPVKKVIKLGSGCALMKDQKNSFAIIKAVTKNTCLPVSIKIRAGIEKTDALSFLESIADLNWKTVIIHGRTFSQGFSGNINTKLLKKIKERFPQKNVIANGGIFSPEDAKQILEETNADGIAIARGALGKPWIFQQTKSFLETGSYQELTKKEVKSVVKRHIKYFQKYKKMNLFREMKKHLGWYFKGFSGAKNIRRDLFEIKTPEEALKIINSL